MTLRAAKYRSTREDRLDDLGFTIDLSETRHGAESGGERVMIIWNFVFKTRIRAPSFSRSVVASY